MAKYVPSILSTSSGSAVSDSDVNPTRSQNSAETTLRSSVPAALDASRRDPHRLQNCAPTGLSPPHTRHRTMSDSVREPDGPMEPVCCDPAGGRLRGPGARLEDHQRDAERQE